MKSKNPRPTPSVQEPDHDFSIEDIASALFAQAGITSGLWRLAAKLRFAALTAGLPGPSDEEEPRPAGMVAIDGLALFKVDKPGQLVFDAAAPSPRRVTTTAPPTKRRASRGKAATPK
jgi:hypothetical protein